MWTSYLDWGLADFSGYIAADELYDGPFCVLSIVDNRTFKRLLYQVLDHDPEHAKQAKHEHRDSPPRGLPRDHLLHRGNLAQRYGRKDGRQLRLRGGEYTIWVALRSDDDEAR